MKLTILGGPHDGSSTEVPKNIQEGQKFIVEGVEYFFNKPLKKAGRLIYYSTSKEA